MTIYDVLDTLDALGADVPDYVTLVGDNMYDVKWEFEQFLASRERLFGLLILNNLSAAEDVQDFLRPFLPIYKLVEVHGPDETTLDIHVPRMCDDRHESPWYVRDGYGDEYTRVIVVDESD